MKRLFSDKTDWLFSEYAYNIYEKCLYNKTFKEYKRIISTYLEHPDIKCFFCSVENKNVGIIVYQLLQNDTAEILGIAVADFAQNKGVGTYMIRESAKALSSKKIIAKTDDDAIEFYKKAGFKIIKEEVTNYVDGDVTRYTCLLEY